MFKIGDKVKVLFSECGAPEETTGEQGVVKQIDVEDADALSYYVLFSKYYAGFRGWWYTAEELQSLGGLE